MEIVRWRYAGLICISLVLLLEHTVIEGKWIEAHLLHAIPCLPVNVAGSRQAVMELLQLGKVFGYAGNFLTF